MSVAIWIYIIEVVNNFNAGLNVIFGFLIATLFIYAIISFFVQGDEDLRESMLKSWVWISKKTYILVIVFCVLCIVPSKTSMYLMLGSAYLKDTNVPAKVYEALNLKLDNVINDMRKRDDTKT